MINKNVYIPSYLLEILCPKEILLLCTPVYKNSVLLKMQWHPLKNSSGWWPCYKHSLNFTAVQKKLHNCIFFFNVHTCAVT